MTDIAVDAALDEALGAPTPNVTTPTAVNASAGELVVLPLSEIHPDPDNPREELRDIDGLARSIREQGLIQPMIVRRDHEGRLIIVAGHRRYAALQKIGRTRVEVIIRKAMQPDDVLAKMLIENGQRAGLDPIEEARALHRLKVMGDLTDDQLGRKVGRSQSVVSARLALLSLPAEDQENVRTGWLKLGAAVRVARLNQGKVRRQGVGRAWHLGPDHGLARNAQARCRRLGHKTGRSVGGVACGECWESIIRADERQHTLDQSVKRGSCIVCGSDAAYTNAASDSQQPHP